MQVGSARITILGQCLAFVTMTGGVRSTISTVNCSIALSVDVRLPCRPPRISESRYSNMDDYSKENRAEFNCTQW